MPAKKTEIKIETREVWIVHRPQHEAQAWCPLCAAQVELLRPEEAAQLIGIGIRLLFRLLEQAQLHFLETPAGGVLICLPSLLAGCERAVACDAPQPKTAGLTDRR